MSIKIFHAPKKSKELQKRITVRIPKRMLDYICGCLEQQGMSQRQRSEWIADAIINLSRIPYYSELVVEDWVEPGYSTAIQITLPVDASIAMANMIELVTNSDTGIDEPQSAIVRTAISQKLISLVGVEESA